MIVDVHTHLWDRPEQLGPGSAARLREQADAPWGKLDVTPEAYDQAMATVDYAFILGLTAQRIEAHIPHALIARHVARQPDRYLGFAGIDPMAPNFNESLDEAIERGLAGVVISPAAQGFHPTHTNALHLYERCQALGMPVLVHPGTHLDRAVMLEFSQPHLFDEVGRSFPDLKVVLAQMGHPWVDPALLLIGKHHNFYADLSDLVTRPWQLYNVLLLAHQQGVMSHLLIGSDFPFNTPEKAIVTIFSVNTLTHGTNLPSIPREQLRSVVERDALGCLGLDHPGLDQRRDEQAAPRLPEQELPNANPQAPKRESSAKP